MDADLDIEITQFHCTNEKATLTVKKGTNVRLPYFQVSYFIFAECKWKYTSLRLLILDIDQILYRESSSRIGIDDRSFKVQS